MPISPLTGSLDTTLIFTIETSKLIKDWKETFGIDISNELAKIEDIYLYQCNKTKLLFFKPSTATGSNSLYEKLQTKDWFYMPHKWEHQVALQDIESCNDVLEVGCAFGSFVEAGLEAGIKIRGIELNNAAVEIAKGKNLPVTRQNLSDFANAHVETLDAVCSFQVLEHVPNPKDFLEWSIQSLKIGGQLIICVPNSESFLKNQYNLLDLPPHHMLRWSETSFRALESLLPIKLEKVIKEPLALYHVSSFLDSYSGLFKARYPLSAFLLNRYMLGLCEKILQLGPRKYLTGQSLYVQFRRTS